MRTPPIHGNPDRIEPERRGGGPAVEKSQPQARHQFSLLLPMEIRIWWPERFRIEAPQGTGSGERQAGTAVRRYGIGKQHHKRSALRPPEKPNAVRYLAEEHRGRLPLYEPIPGGLIQKR